MLKQWKTDDANGFNNILENNEHIKPVSIKQQNQTFQCDQKPRKAKEDKVPSQDLDICFENAREIYVVLHW